MIPWLNNNFRHFKPTAAIAINATRHMNKIERKKLFSPDIEPMRTAEGRWFEAIVYEMFLDISKKSGTIKYLAMKGADAPSRRENVKIGQNGLFYSKYGDITIRGNGQDLAEFDMLLVDSDNHVAFAEVVTSPSDLKEFEIEIAYKKKLLGYLYGQKITPFLLVSSFDLSNYSVVKRLAKDRTNAIIHTSSCEQIKSLVKHYRPRIIYNLPENHPKLIRATDIPMKNPFDYKRYHDEVKNQLFTEMNRKPGKIQPQITDRTGQLVKKILYGGLFPPAIKAVCDTYGLTVKGKKVTYEDFSKYYSKAIIATDMPGYELIIYLRSKQKKEYHKMIQMKDGHFKFERPTPPKVGFFLWLETIQPMLGARITLQVLDAFSIHEQPKK
ncbi:MAG: hypothetical protein M0Q92_11640 [Methanoregula sp.]|jgi:hypothetical protein|nr:hypothetical protein [Methanoregula sp.]